MLLTSESRLRIANPQHPLARKTTGNRKRAAPKDFRDTLSRQTRMEATGPTELKIS